VNDEQRMELAEPPAEPVRLAPPVERPARGPYHSELAPELEDELHLTIGKGLALIERDEHEPPGALLEAIARFVEGARQRPLSEAAALALSCLYGHVLCLKLGWGWAHLRRAKSPGIVVISPDRRYALGPRRLIDAALAESSGAALLDLARRLEEQRELPPAAAGSYLRLPQRARRGAQGRGIT
jgi:hypothetical protein